MTQQEKVLAGCLVGVIAVAGGYTLVKSKIIAPRVRLKQEIKQETERLGMLETRLASAPKKISAWQAHTRQTLHTDWPVAHATFREDVEDLLKRNGLTEGLTFNQLPERPDKKGAREGFVELPLSVNVKGELDNLVNFLKDLYQRPYLVRIEKLHLGAELSGRSKGRKGRGGGGEPKLSISMTLSTLVLPKLEDVGHPTIDLEAMNSPDGDVVLASTARLSEDPDAYNEIARTNIFDIYEPPQVAVKPPEPKPAKPERGPEPPRPPPPPPRPDLVLLGVGRLDDGPVAYVVNADDPTEPPEAYSLNAEVDDGRLVLIVPEGIVVRVSAEGVRGRPAKTYFYPLGANFKEREEVDPVQHPEVSRLLQLVLKP
jgi:Tfp pilus assembly protein PilO